LQVLQAFARFAIFADIWGDASRVIVDDNLIGRIDAVL
jgi:hypothetical protein